MARKNQVTLTFAGETRDLEQSFDRVTTGSRNMDRDVSDSFSRVGDAADTLDTRAMGFRDTMTGVEDTSRGVSEIMKGNLFDGVFLLGMGFGDLMSGVANFGTQFVKTVGSFIAEHAKMLAVHMANAARMAVGWLIAMGPIALVIVAIAAIIGVLALLGVGFDDVKRWAETAWNFILGVIQGVFNWLKTNWPLVLAILTGPIGIAVLLITRNWDTIKNGATAVKDWIVGKFNALVSFITGLPGRISSTAGNMFDGVKSAARGALNAVIGWWNNLSLTFPSVSLPGWLGGGTIGGWTLSTPNIPFLHQGGVFRAPSGRREGLAMLLDKERVLRPGEAPGPTVIIYVQGSIRSDRDLVQLVRDELGRGGFGGLL